MAKAIKQIENEEYHGHEERSEDLEALLQQIIANKKSIQDILTVLTDLQATGMFDLVKSLLAKKTEVGAIAMEQINQPGLHHMIKNGIGIVGLLSSIEPTQLKPILDGLSEGLQHAAKHNGKLTSASVWGLFKATKDPNVKTSILAMIHFLEGMGKSLNVNAPQERNENPA